MHNFPEKITFQKPKAKESEEEREKEAISLIYENIVANKKNESYKDELINALPEGKEILNILKRLGTSDIVGFLQKYEEKMKKVPLNEVPDEKLVVSLLKKENFDPNLIELGLSLDSLKIKFKKNIIEDILRRDFLEKKLSEIEPFLPTIESDLLIFGKAYDDLKILMFQKGMRHADFKKISAKEQLEYKNAKVNFDDIIRALDCEILRISRREDEYKDLDEDQYRKLWSHFEKLDNEIAKAKKEKIDPQEYFKKNILNFLAEIFANRYDSLTEKKEEVDILSKEYFSKYII